MDRDALLLVDDEEWDAIEAAVYSAERAASSRGRRPAAGGPTGAVPAAAHPAATAAGEAEGNPVSSAPVAGPQHKRAATLSPSTLRSIVSETGHAEPQQREGCPVELAPASGTLGVAAPDRVLPAPRDLFELAAGKPSSSYQLPPPQQPQPQPQQSNQQQQQQQQQTPHAQEPPRQLQQHQDGNPQEKPPPLPAQQQPQPQQPQQQHLQQQHLQQQHLQQQHPPLPQSRRLPFSLIQQPVSRSHPGQGALKPASSAPAPTGNQGCSSSGGGSGRSSSCTGGGSSDGGGGGGGAPADRLQRRQSDPALSAPPHAAAGIALGQRLPAAAYRGRITYAKTAAEVDAACTVLLRSGAKLVGFDIEWRSTFKKGAPVGKAALLQLCYQARDGADVQTEPDGRGAVALLLHIIHSGVTPRLREVLAREEMQLVGVNIGGDALKMLNDWGVRCTSCCELGDLANGRVLAHLPGVAMNIETKRWSLAGLAAEVLGVEVPKPQRIRLGNWEGRLTEEHKHYAALDAFMGLHLHWVLSALPRRLDASDRHREVLRARAQQAALAKAAAAAEGGVDPVGPAADGGPPQAPLAAAGSGS